MSAAVAASLLAGCGAQPAPAPATEAPKTETKEETPAAEVKEETPAAEETVEEAEHHIKMGYLG